ncbi:MAG: hypothetical protein IKR54_07065 [Lachnospiraceae bacterium]|nr:hypothetical protein [Lachnospiraceae bacterium]
MKPSLLAIILAALILPFLISYIIDAKATDAQNETTSELNKSVANSLYETALTSDMKLEEPDSRIGFYDNFLDILAHNLGYYITDEQRTAMEQDIPMIIFCVDNGYYCVYSDYNTTTKLFTKTSGVLVPYSRRYGNYNVVFNMSGNVVVTNLSNSAVTSGMFERVFTELGRPAQLDFMASVAEYETELSDIIAQRITIESENIIENHNYGNIESYTINIPAYENSGVRAVTKPCVIAMYQGDTMQTNDSRVDIYTFSSVEIQDLVPFEVYAVFEADGTVSLYYHSTASGHTMPNVIATGTLDYCASLGANPCPECY